MKNYLLLLLIIAFTVALPLLSEMATGMVVFDNLPKIINKQLIYQSLTLLSTIAFLGILRFCKPTVFQIYFKKGKVTAPIIPVPEMGIQPKPQENWGHVGRNFAIVISLVTTFIIYFQVIKSNTIPFGKILYVLPFGIVFSLTNSFVEEMITRFGVVVALKGVFSDKVIAFIAAIIFGIVHYWGTPGGMTGVLTAGFLGWFLAKSILETQGIFWAWFIHFLQDVIILTALFTIS